MMGWEQTARKTLEAMPRYVRVSRSNVFFTL